jgi:hypothetical protein
MSTTWTLAQVAQAEGLRASVVVADEVIRRDPEHAQAFAEDEMAKRLTSMAHPFGIELHRDDFEVIWECDEATPWQVTGRMRWHPTTNAVELRGGHLDGQRWATQRVGDPFRVLRPATTPWWSDADETEATAAITEIVDTYELVGWREDERVWVYEARK